ncbi:hypothetical protein [Azohydromonas caseinilytica]|uniref:Uncharacterized protein n=1 Tax=Azohydromonas caseinilytica TaxID=2728836 RepID=A0A848F9X9_9BURK|nr:hypothetical protein [Azohydromonas caseinilytica]NML15656.1 hypothetical protein [Azohydromonas caseinilytica]
MNAPAAPPMTPWHKRVLDWLGVELSEESPVLVPVPAPAAPGAGERFPWELAPPPPRVPQWGAADRPELLLGLQDMSPQEAPRAGSSRC